MPTSPHAGFSLAEKPWLPVDERHLSRSMDQQMADPTSFRAQVKRRIAQRKAGEILMGGDLEVLDSPEDMVVFKRKSGNKIQDMIFNFGTKTGIF